jgi:hypothetical protein
MAVPITERALVQRINRKLAQDSWRVLKKTRGARAIRDLGEFYVLDVNRNFVITSHVDPVAFAKKLGVLEAYEELEDTA